MRHVHPIRDRGAIDHFPRIGLLLMGLFNRTFRAG